MRELLIIVEREFRERVQTRSFVIGTVLFPVFMIAIILLPALVGDSGSGRTIVLVDRAPAGVGETFEQVLVASGDLLDAAARGEVDAEALAEGASVDQGDAPYTVQREGADVSVDRLNERILAEEIDGYVILPEDVLETSEVIYRARNITNRFVLRDVRMAATAAVQVHRLGSAGLDAAAVQQLMEPVRITTARITEAGEEGGDAETTFLVAYLLAFLAYFVIAMYGHAVMRSVIQEKVTRISEILVSTVRAVHLMAGKIAGVSAAALLQVGIWAAMIALAASQSDLLADRFGVPTSAVDALSFPPGLAVVLLLLFVLGFLLYAALFAALGAAMSSEQEAQPYQMVLMLPLFVPLLFLGAVTNDPEGTLSLFLGLFPLTAPVAMPMRLAAAPPDPAIIGLSIGLLVIATVLVAWIAGKIYRIGILATGKKPSLPELIRWMRAA